MICTLALVSGMLCSGTDADLHGRLQLTTPGVDRRVKVASATTAPWVNANGWRFRRTPDGKFYYDLRAGKATLAAAEAFAFGVDAVLKIDPSDRAAFEQLMQFLGTIPKQKLPETVDFGFVDDGSPSAGELLNLLSRRNLLYRVEQSPDSKLRLNVTPTSDNPNLFAAKVREKLGDDQRSLRVYGSETVLCRLTSNGSQARIHVLNYSGQRIDGLRLRVRGTWTQPQLYSPDTKAQPSDFAIDNGFTEFSLPSIGPYAVVDLKAGSSSR